MSKGQHRALAAVWWEKPNSRGMQALRLGIAFTALLVVCVTGSLWWYVS